MQCINIPCRKQDPRLVNPEQVGKGYGSEIISRAGGLIQAAMPYAKIEINKASLTPTQSAILAAINSGEFMDTTIKTDYGLIGGSLNNKVHKVIPKEYARRCFIEPNETLSDWLDGIQKKLKIKEVS
jgi:hypothetical protein